jgi:hypothetical protein
MAETLKKLRLGNGVVAAAAVAIGLGVGLFFGKTLPPSVPLFYSLPWGEEQLVSPWELAIPLGIAVVITTGSIMVSRFFKSEPVLAVIVQASGIMIGVILIMGVLRSVLLVV